MTDRNETLDELADAVLRETKAKAMVAGHGLFPPTKAQVEEYLAALWLIHDRQAEEATGYQVRGKRWRPNGLMLNVITVPPPGRKRYGKEREVPVMEVVNRMPPDFRSEHRATFEAALQLYSEYSRQESELCDATNQRYATEEKLVGEYLYDMYAWHDGNDKYRKMLELIEVFNSESGKPFYQVVEEPEYADLELTDPEEIVEQYLPAALEHYRKLAA